MGQKLKLSLTHYRSENIINSNFLSTWPWHLTPTKLLISREAALHSLTGEWKLNSRLSRGTYKLRRSADIICRRTNASALVHQHPQFQHQALSYMQLGKTQQTAGVPQLPFSRCAHIFGRHSWSENLLLEYYSGSYEEFSPLKSYYSVGGYRSFPLLITATAYLTLALISSLEGVKALH